MDFFERQDRARRSTKWLIVYFGTGVTLLTLAVYAVVLALFLVTRHHLYFANPPPLEWWHPKLFAGVVACTLSVIALGSVSKTIELNQGGSVVACTLGGRLISPTTAEPDERKLLNVVEEMAIASGMPVPEVYLLPQERAINAFAAGHTTSDAVIAVTSGAIKLLSRDELQGVIAHEFSHILNGDMRLNIQLMGAVFGILCLTMIGRLLAQTPGRSNRSRDALPLLGLSLIAIGSIGVFFARLIQAAVSRQREYLADASAVQFTRNPDGLTGALKKIGGLTFGSRLQAPQAGAASHMFFGNGMRSSWFHLLDTHPALGKRILAIDPNFDGTFPKTDLLLPKTIAAKLSAEAGRPAFTLPNTVFPTNRPLAGLAGAFNVGAGAIGARAGVPTTAHLRYAGELRDEIPVSVQNAARESMGAATLIYALLLSEKPDVQAKQLSELGSAASQGICQETLRLLPEVRLVSSRAKLPLVNLALPGLRHFSSLQFREFTRAIKALVESDGEIDLFEYMLQKVVMRHLEPRFNQARKPVLQYYALKPFLGDCAILLSELAYVGQESPEEVMRAFQCGAQLLSVVAQAEITMVPQHQCDLEQVDAALNRLNLAVPQIKKNVLEACSQTVAADGVVQEMEAELLRAIADTLDCPLPPFIGDLIPQPV